MARNVPITYGDSGRAVPQMYDTRPAGESGASLADRVVLEARRRLAGAAALLAQQGIDPEQDEDFKLYRQIVDRRASTEGEAQAQRDLYARFDNLYYASTVTQGGADHWPEDPDRQPGHDGRVHVSVNTPPPYVDIPASLQAIQPYVNAIPDSADKRDQEAADRREKVMWGWWWENDLDLLLQELCQSRALYGAAAVKVRWDADRKLPTATLVESIENLRLGWGSSDFHRVDWALYTYGLTPQAIREEFGLDVGAVKLDDQTFEPVVTGTTHDDPLGQLQEKWGAARIRSEYERRQIEVYDYWYKKPAKKVGGKPEIWNAVYVGNHQVENKRHPEYDAIPYVWFPNGKVPGSPYGRSELYDLEQLFREQDERLSDAAQMLEQVVGGQMWKVEGQDAPQPGYVADIHPKRGTTTSPGPGNTLNAIQPAVPMFQAEEYLTRLEKKITEVSGLSDILLGLVPGRAFGSSKAINALLQMYEPRIGLKRQLLYRGLRELWAMSARVWERKDSAVAKLIDGNYRLDIRPPELTVRDDMEQAQKVATLLQNRVISIRRAADMVGVDNPSEELAAIRDERTDAALFPSEVMQQITLINALKAQGAGSPAEAQQQNQAGAQQALSPREKAVEAVRQRRASAPPPKGTNSANVPVIAPGAENLPANAVTNGAAKQELQTMVTGDQATGRILSSQQL